MHHVSERRYYVKIIGGPRRVDAQLIYFRNELPFAVITKWMWYFEYRAALYRVQHPRHHIQFTHGSYDFVPSPVQAAKKRKDLIAGKRATLTKYRKAIELAEQNWNGLFPITDDPHYQKAAAKLRRLNSELAALLQSEPKEIV